MRVLKFCLKVIGFWLKVIGFLVLSVISVVGSVFAVIWLLAFFGLYRPAPLHQWVVLDPKTDICTITPVDGIQASVSPLAYAELARSHGWTVSVEERRFEDDPIPGGVSEIVFSATKPGNQAVSLIFWTSLKECNEHMVFAKHPVPDQDLQ